MLYKTGEYIEPKLVTARSKLKSMVEPKHGMSRKRGKSYKELLPGMNSLNMQLPIFRHDNRSVAEIYNQKRVTRDTSNLSNLNLSPN